jgi:hypothetical protein
MNPECRAGKHSNCDEKGWRDDLGHIGPCLCGCHEKTSDEGGKHATPAYERPVDLDSIEYRDWGKEPYRCPNCDMPVNGIHDVHCPKRVGL